MNVYRIAHKNYINDLTGTGAKLYGGRWNNKGVSVLYTSTTTSLALLEYIVNITFPLIPSKTFIATIFIPDNSSMETIKTTDLPEKWKNSPSPSALKEISTTWINDNRSLILKFPSAIITKEYNILINPLHPEMKHVRIVDVEKFLIDKRLHQIKKSQS